MRFLIDADLPYSLVGIIEQYEHSANHVRDVRLGGAPDAQIAAFARSRRLALMTGDFDFADIRNYPPAEYAGIVVFVIPQTAGLPAIHRLAHEFLQSEVVNEIDGKLVIVEFGRIRVRG